MLWEACYGQPGEKRTQNSGPKSLFADGCSQRLLRFYGKRRHFGKPGYAAVYKFEVSESVKSYFRQAVIFRKKALRMKKGKAFFAIARSQPARH